MYLKHEIINNDIDTVTKSKHLPLNSFRRLDYVVLLKSSQNMENFLEKWMV